ncbi:MAG TPA: non-ribosomal peptide synthetase, partial [Gaiellaceae bacterium]
EAESFHADDVCCLKTRLAFVDSLWELLGPLAAGVPLVVAGESAVRDPRALAELIVREGVTRLVGVPSLLAALIDAAPDALARSRLRRLTSSGEPLTGSLARRLRSLLPGCALFNLYGSTEVTADATWHEVADEEDELVPIGRPLANMRVRLLGATRELVPVGAVGELFVGGAGLATGYVGQAEESERGRFTADPLLPGERLYRTGDLARWRVDGRLEFVGRADRQLKIRGVRIEPDELERAIRAYPGVAEAAVIVQHGTSGPELAAFAAGADLDLEDLRSSLHARLPEQLLPARLVALERLPRLPSGKPDPAGLAELSTADELSNARDATAPRTTAERLVAEAYAETLGRALPGADDDFFALGGHSLLATRLVSALGARFRLAVPLAWIFEHPMVSDLARTIEDALVADIRREGVSSAPAAAEAEER